MKNFLAIIEVTTKRHLLESGYQKANADGKQQKLSFFSST
jgi:hypothetical protein